MKGFCFYLFLVLSLLLTCGCEAEKEKEKESGTATEAKGVDLAKVDVAAQVEILTSTFLFPSATRERALVDVAKNTWGIERETGKTDAQLITATCDARQGGCADKPIEQHYYRTLALLLDTLTEAAGDQGVKVEPLDALAAQVDQILAAPISQWPEGDEPLGLDLADPLLFVSATEVVVTLSGFEVSRVAWDPAALDNPALADLLSLIKRNDIFPVAGLPAPEKEGKAITPGDGVLRVTPRADLPSEVFVAFLSQAQRRGLQAFDLILRSNEYGMLGSMRLNLVPSAVKGADYAVLLGPEQAVYHYWKDDTTQAVPWQGIERLSEVIRAPLGQMVLYVGLEPGLTMDQMIKGLDAIRERCGDSELCPELQLAIALK